MSFPYRVGVAPIHDVENTNAFTFDYQQPTAVPSDQGAARAFGTAMHPPRMSTSMPPYPFGYQTQAVYDSAWQNDGGYGPLLDIRNTMQVMQPNQHTVAAGSLHSQPASYSFVPLQQEVPKAATSASTEKVTKNALVSLHLSPSY